ncbi:AbiH family protein [Arachidicoccus terrestris]|uniref:AbiH family protein n=1 Tax=Arachidicoccus terrestris TaxID=2875539 RepID=UPI001CC6B544|nr:AbiH family protein [Arachidicoccus terrestris]UAY55711.1 bacteriophage abortive infection AbiH family protein [Arachidicoccus terrestris]
MNRLILIGNGFDLAHGLDTRYNDFILWYLKKCFKQAYIQGQYVDEICTIEKTHLAHQFSPIGDPISDYIGALYKKNELHLLFGLSKESFYITTLRNRAPKQTPFEATLKLDFPKKLLLQCNLEKWVDVENEYYTALKEILNSKLNTEQKEKALDKLNLALNLIKKELTEYLGTIPTDIRQPAFNDILASPINRNELLKTNLARNVAPKDTLVLNFNYTDTIEQYIQNNAATKKTTINYIHGKLNDPHNPIIFGFGDELDADYAKMELEKTKGYFEHIKSFGYFKTSNYYNLIRFLDSDEYQVFILGHSCGLSDRTMLNMIFEHENCKSIKIYYYQENKQKNNYTELTQEISRHFKDKLMMRRKIVSIDKSSPMPQVE